MRRLLLVLAITLLAAALASCGDDRPAGPPEIEYGRDVCTQCNMIISEPRFAAAYRDADGHPALFDDIGDLLRYAHDEGVLDEVDAWVHDYGTQEWIEAPKAWFVRSSVETPMASGLVAFTIESDARDFAANHDGEVLRWKDVVAKAGDASAGSTMPHGTDQEG